jgi:hypothetical protein
MDLASFSGTGVYEFWLGGGGKAVYFIYLFCHQLPERSFFFFGEKTMYSLSEPPSGRIQLIP